MLLNYGEQIHSQAAVESATSGRRGTIYVTNQRVVVEFQKSQGLIASSLGNALVETVLSAPLGQLTNAHAASKVIGRPLLRIESTRGNVVLKTHEAELIVLAISRAKSAIPPPPPPGQYGSPHSVVVNVSPGYGQLAAPPPPSPPPPPVVMFACTHCGTPQYSHVVKCASCGAPMRKF